MTKQGYYLSLLLRQPRSSVTYERMALCSMQCVGLSRLVRASEGKAVLENGLESDMILAAMAYYTIRIVLVQQQVRPCVNRTARIHDF